MNAIRVGGRAAAKQLAERLGVVTSTITRAFDEQSCISGELRQRSLAMVDEIGYRPNAIARLLSQRRSGSVALVTGDMSNPFYPASVREFSLRLRQTGRQLLLFWSGRRATPVRSFPATRAFPPRLTACAGSSAVWSYTASAWLPACQGDTPTREGEPQRLDCLAPAADALFCVKDVMALGVLSHLRVNTSLRVLLDVAVVGFDDIRDAAYPENSLTTVLQPVGAMIDCAIQLFDEGRPGGSVAEPLREVPGWLVLRSSA